MPKSLHSLKTCPVPCSTVLWRLTLLSLLSFGICISKLIFQPKAPWTSTSIYFAQYKKGNNFLKNQCKPSNFTSCCYPHRSNVLLDLYAEHYAQLGSSGATGSRLGSQSSQSWWPVLAHCLNELGTSTLWTEVEDFFPMKKITIL